MSTPSLEISKSEARGAVELMTDTPRTVRGPFTVSIEEITAPVTFKSLGDAVAALWESLRPLPLGWTQYEAYRYFFNTAGAEERVTTFLERDRCLVLSFAMAGRSHAVRVEVPR